MIKMQLWRTRDEQERRNETPGQVRAGVQARGREAGEGGAGGVCDGTGVEGTQGMRIPVQRDQ
jgi:hypothetical protein